MHGSPLYAVEVEDLKKISNGLTVLLSEKQKQEKVSALGNKRLPVYLPGLEPS